MGSTRSLLLCFGTYSLAPLEPGTYSKYNSIDDKIDDLHYYTTFIKFGLGRASYDASQEIRKIYYTRRSASFVNKFDESFDNYFDEILDYLDITKDEFRKTGRIQVASSLGER